MELGTPIKKQEEYGGVETLERTVALLRTNMAAERGLEGDWNQCCGSGIFIPDPDFYPSRIPDLGSRI